LEEMSDELTKKSNPPGLKVAGFYAYLPSMIALDFDNGTQRPTSIAMISIVA